MVGPFLATIPLWQKLVALSLAKKLTVLGIAYAYGFPRLYRRSQKAVRLLTRSQDGRQQLSKYVRTAFRLPARLLHFQPASKGSIAQKTYVSWRERLAAGKHSFASSPLVQQQKQRGRDTAVRLSALKAQGLQTLLGMASRNLNRSGGLARASGPGWSVSPWWRRHKAQPYSFVPAVE